MRLRLAEVRKRRFLSQRELAAMTNLQQTTISALELGKQSPRLSTVRRLAEALGVEPQDLIAEDKPDD